MIVNNKTANERLSNPMNLFNKLRNGDKKDNAMSLFGIGKKGARPEIRNFINPFEKNDAPREEPKTQLVPLTKNTEPAPEKESTELGSILDDHEATIKLGLAHNNAVGLLNKSVELLTQKLDDVKADKLPSVIAAASKTVESIRREQNERNKNNKDREVHFHFYTPEQRKVSEYEVIDVAS